MNLQERNNVHVSGHGPAMVFAHGFGCDQSMWRLLVPEFEARYTVVLFDLVGSGKSDLSAYDQDKYATLHGFADDVLEIVDAYSDGPAIFVGHSVSATIGMLAAIKRPGLFKANLMIGPSPSLVNDGDYRGGLSAEDVQDLLHALESNYLGWSSTVAPAIMGAPDQPHLGEELVNSFCRTDPEIAKHFARVTFLADHRADLAKVTTPTLIIQSNDDFLAPVEVGEYIHRAIAGSSLCIVENIGHCPHLSAPEQSIAGMNAFLKERGL